MELTKEQVKYIDHRLESEGVKYWDIRIEMLDHVVSGVEKELNSGDNFKDAVQNSFIFLGWNGSFEDLTKNRLKGINKIIRKQYFNQIRSFFTNFISFFLLLFLIGVYYAVFLISSLKTFKLVLFFILFSPIIYAVIFHFSDFSKNGKSGYLNYSSFYIFFSFLLFNAVIQFVKPGGIIPVTKEVQLLVWFVASSLNTIFSLAGILVHLKTSQNIKNIELKLNSL